MNQLPSHRLEHDLLGDRLMREMTGSGGKKSGARCLIATVEPAGGGFALEPDPTGVGQRVYPLAQ